MDYDIPENYEDVSNDNELLTLQHEHKSLMVEIQHLETPEWKQLNYAVRVTEDQRNRYHAAISTLDEAERRAVEKAEKYDD